MCSPSNTVKTSKLYGCVSYKYLCLLYIWYTNCMCFSIKYDNFIVWSKWTSQTCTRNRALMLLWHIVVETLYVLVMNVKGQHENTNRPLYRKQTPAASWSIFYLLHQIHCNCTLSSSWKGDASFSRQQIALCHQPFLFLS